MKNSWFNSFKNFSEFGKKNVQEKSIPFIKEVFQSETGKGKIAEIYIFIKKLGLNPERTLVRVFNQDLINLVEKNGTDRIGVDEFDNQKWKEMHATYHEKLKLLGLKNEDGIYAFPLTTWGQDYSGSMFEEESLDMMPHQKSVAIYDGGLLNSIEDDKPASSKRQLGQFFYFQDPKNKKGALKGILVQK